jgi:hypothetical protein
MASEINETGIGHRGTGNERTVVKGQDYEIQWIN